jgi:hypothetical protein
MRIPTAPGITAAFSTMPGIPPYSQIKLAAEEMEQILKNLKKDHILIFSTHIMELALDLCDEIDDYMGY